MAEAPPSSQQPPPASADNDGDVVSDSDSDSFDLSGLSSDPDGEQTITPAQLLEELLMAWSNEKLAPDLLPHRDDLVECARDQLEGIDRQVNGRAGGRRVPKDLLGFLHKQEVARVRYLVTDLLRTRLSKVHAYAELAVAPGSRLTGRLSPAEAQFARDLVSSTHRLYDSLVLNRLPQFLKPRPEPAETPKPNLQAFVFFRVRAEADGVVVQPAVDSAPVELKFGDQHLMRYAAVEHLVLADKLQLI